MTGNSPGAWCLINTRPQSRIDYLLRSSLINTKNSIQEKTIIIDDLEKNELEKLQPSSFGNEEVRTSQPQTLESQSPQSFGSEQDLLPRFYCSKPKSKQEPGNNSQHAHRLAANHSPMFYCITWDDASILKATRLARNPLAAESHPICQRQSDQISTSLYPSQCTSNDAWWPRI